MQKNEYKRILNQLGFDYEEAEEEVTEAKELLDYEKSLDEPSIDIPMSDWIILSCYAGKGLAESVRAVNDAYKLGFMTGKAVY